MLRFAGTYTAPGGGGASNVYFGGSSLADAGAATSVGVPVPLPNGLRGLRHLHVHVLANTLSQGVSLRVQRESESSSVVVAVGASATGVVSDTTHSAAINPGDRVELVLEVPSGLGAGESITFNAAVAIS